jgi:hypothetical protein
MEDKTITIAAQGALRETAGAGRRLRASIAALATALLAALALGAPAQAALSDVGDPVPAHGFPEWYQDGSGLRLALCVENADPFCTSTAPDPGPATVPGNFPEETFYWSAEALIDKRNVGVRARLVLAQEAAFLNGPVAAGDQVTFGRIRVRLDGMKPGATYRITHPYGTEKITADKRGRARMTDDVGCDATPCDFRAALATRIGPFLRWDPRVAPAAPAGYIGNPLREHRVVGSPRGTNLFRVTGPEAGGPGVKTIETPLFTVEGKLAATQGTAAPPAGGGTTQPGGTTAPPPDGTTAPPPDGTTTPPAGGTTTPPAGGTTTPLPPGAPTPAPAPPPLPPAIPLPRLPLHLPLLGR